MRRIIYMVLMNLFHAPVWLFKISRMAGPKNRLTKEEKHEYISRMTRRIIRRGRVTLVCTGVENIPDQTSFIMFPNHQGLFDVLALFATCPKPFSVVIKKEAANLILVRQVLGAMQSLAMDREDLKDQVHVIGEVTKRVKGGDNFVIFPEGHRSRKGNEILDFKSGTFKSAVKAGCPIVPVALINSFRPFDISSLRRETVQIHYMKPIYPEQYEGLRTSEIALMVHDRIQDEINRNI